MKRNLNREYMAKRQRLSWSIFGWIIVASIVVLVGGAILRMLAVTPA